MTRTRDEEVPPSSTGTPGPGEPPEDPRRPAEEGTRPSAEGGTRRGGPRPSSTEATMRTIRSLASPVRRAIVKAMVLGTPMRVSDVAAAIGAPPNSVSYHLRQLERADIVHRVPPEDVPDTHDAREAWWVIDEWRGLRLEPEDLDGEPGARAALDALGTLMSSEAADMFTFERVRASNATGWPGFLADTLLRLPRDEAEALTEDIGTLLEAAGERSREYARAGRTDLHRYDVRVAVLPTPDRAGAGAPTGPGREAPAGPGREAPATATSPVAPTTPAPVDEGGRVAPPGR